MLASQGCLYLERKRAMYQHGIQHVISVHT